jgi:hypothetical protein
VIGGRGARPAEDQAGTRTGTPNESCSPASCSRTDGDTCVPTHSTYSRTCRKPAGDRVDPSSAVSGDPSRDLVRGADQMRAEPVVRRRLHGNRRVQHVAKVKKANSAVNRGGGAQSRRDVSEVDIAPQASMPTERPKRHRLQLTFLFQRRRRLSPVQAPPPLLNIANILGGFRLPF